MAYRGLPRACGELLLQGVTHASETARGQTRGEATGEVKARERAKGYETEQSEFIVRHV